MHEITTLLVELREIYDGYGEFNYQAQMQADAKAEELIKGFACDVLVDMRLQKELFPVELKPLVRK